MIRKILVLAVLVLILLTFVVQWSFAQRIKDPGTHALVEQTLQDFLGSGQVWSWKSSPWKTSWFLAARSSSWSLHQSKDDQSLVAFKSVYFDIDPFPAIFRGQVRIDFEASERNSGARLRGQANLNLMDQKVTEVKLQAPPVPIEARWFMSPEGPSAWLTGMKGTVKVQGGGNLDKGRFQLEIKDVIWISPWKSLPNLQLGSGSTELSYQAETWTMQPPLLFSDPVSGLNFQLRYKQKLRLSVQGPFSLVAAIAREQRCPISNTLELVWSNHGFECL